MTHFEFCGKLIGSGCYSCVYADKTTPDKVVHIIGNAEDDQLKAEAYRLFNLLIDYKITGDTSIITCKRLTPVIWCKNDTEVKKYIKFIDRLSGRYFDNQPHMMWEYEDLSIRQITALDLATNPDVTPEINAYFALAFEKSLETGWIAFDIHTGNWLSDDNGIWYPLDCAMVM